MKASKIGRAAIALAIGCTAIATTIGTGVTTASASDACNLTKATGLVGYGNGKWVDLRTDAPAPLTNELTSTSSAQDANAVFTFVNAAGHVAIKAANGRFVTVDTSKPTTNSQYGALHATSTSDATRNQWFDSVSLGMGVCALKAVVNGKYVSAELDPAHYPFYAFGELRARASGVGPWEGFVPRGGCQNPFHSGESWGLERTDRGVDYYANGSAGQPVRAICDGTILSLYTPGWPGGTFIYYKLTSGPYAGKCIYQAEHITVASNIHVGSVVHAGDVIGRGYGDNEWGWARAQGAPSTPKVVDSHGKELATDGGRAFARFLRSLGAPTKEDPGAGPMYAGASC